MCSRAPKAHLFGALLAPVMIIVAACDAADAQRSGAMIMSEAVVQSAALPSIPSGFALASRSEGTMDSVPVVVLRHERSDGANTGLGGEHVTVVHDAAGRLKGWTRMVAPSGSGALPSEGEARAVADAFFARHAPDIAGRLQTQWIKPHGERIRVGGGQVEVTGMKVKRFDPVTRTYAWAIVGPNREVITFERDIVWSNQMSMRETEKWLHDGWLATRRS